MKFKIKDNSTAGQTSVTISNETFTIDVNPVTITSKTAGTVTITVASVNTLRRQRWSNRCGASGRPDTDKVAILKVQGAGWINGYADGKFKPDSPITRAETVTIINKVVGRFPWTGTANAAWNDVPASHWAIADIQEASVDHSYLKQANGMEQQVIKP